MTTEAVCFDLDYTLFDYDQYIRGGLDHAADVIERRTGCDVAEELHRLYFEENVQSHTFDRVLERNDLPVTLVSDLVEAFHREPDQLSPYSGVEELLATLDASYDLALVTDGRNGTEKLRALGLDDWFETVLVTHDRSFSKLDEEAFTRPLDELSVDPGDAVYVGDNPLRDVAVPRQLGMFTVHVDQGPYADSGRDEHVPHRRVSSIEEVGSLVPFSDQ